MLGFPSYILLVLLPAQMHAWTCRTVISYVYCIKGLGILALNYCQEMKETRPKSMHYSWVRFVILLKFAAAMKLCPCYTPTDDLFPLRFSSSVSLLGNSLTTNILEDTEHIKKWKSELTKSLCTTFTRYPRRYRTYKKSECLNAWFHSRIIDEIRCQLHIFGLV